MRGRLIAAAGVLLASLPLLAAPADEEQDRMGGKLIFQIVKILATTPNLDREAHSALGSSLEFMFLQLQRSPTKSAAEALAQTAVLQIDAGGGESRDEAILSKGVAMLPLLKTIPLVDYRRLCAGTMAAVCMSEGDVKRHVDDLSDALVHGRLVPN